MANRPIYCVGEDKRLVLEQNVEFKFFNGFSSKQKQRSIASLHEAFLRTHPEKRVLEVSTKAETPLGWALSAFNLQVDYIDGRTISMESAFQGSKVFENGMQYQDLYEVESVRAKKDRRLKESGVLTHFSYKGEVWELEPKTSFYDWLYMRALYKHHPDIIEQLLAYDAFSDIEFNPKRSINCQARTCAMLVSLVKQDMLDEALSDKSRFLEMVYYKPPQQGKLF